MKRESQKNWKLSKSIESLDDRVKQADKQVKQLASEDAVCQRLMAIPGVGSLIATALVSTIWLLTRNKIFYCNGC